MEARLFVSFRQDQMTNNLRVLNLNSRKGHSHLEGNARLFRQNYHWSATPKFSQEELVKFVNGRGFAFEMRIQLMSATRVRLVLIGELPLTNRATPHRL